MTASTRTSEGCRPASSTVARSGTADADVVLVPNAMVAKLAAAGRVTPERVAIGAVRIGAAVRDDAPRVDVSTMPALRQALVAAPSVLLTLAPTGDHLMKVIGQIGLNGQLQSTFVLPLVPVEEKGSAVIFANEFTVQQTGRIGYSVRISPDHFDNPLTRPCNALLKWVSD